MFVFGEFVCDLIINSVELSASLAGLTVGCDLVVLD